MTAVDYMKNRPLLKQLFKEFQDEDLAHIELVYYAAGIPIIHKDSSAEYVYIIVKGICGIFKELVNGEEFCYYKISNLDVIGMSEILAEVNVSRHATIQTLTDVAAFKIKRVYVSQWMQKYPKFYNNLVRGVINRLHNTLIKHVECKKYNSHANIVSYLIYSYELYRHNYEDGYTESVKINETRDMIGNFLGISIRSINSSVEKLKNLDMINVKHGEIYMTKVQYENMIEYKYKLLL